MSLFSRLRLKPISTHRNFSSILNPDSKTTLTTKQKTRTALTLLKTEKNPQKILDICRAASLTPENHLDRVAFSLAISNLKETQSFELIRTFLEELKTRPDLKNDRFYSHSIVLYGQAGMFDHAKRTFKTMGEAGISPTVKSLNALLLACLIAKKYDEVKSIFVEFPKIYGIQCNLDTFNTVIKAFSESGNTSSVYSILAEMDRKRIEPNATTFSTMLAGFYKEEKDKDVGNVLVLMKQHGVKLGLSTYNIRIQSLCKLNKSGEAKALFEEMLARGMKPNAVTYFHLIFGFGKEGNVEEIWRLYVDMLKKGIEPDASCYYTLVYYLCQGGDFENALRACKASMLNQWFPNFATMKMLVNGLVSISKVEEARELVGKMKERFTKVDMWKETEEGLPQPQ